MKSLKNVESIKQVSTDNMLKITKQPESTCPLIDSLIYEKHKVYDVSINFDPSNLTVNIDYLMETINSLNSWSVDIINKHKEISEYIKNPIEKKEIDSYVEEIIKAQNINNINQLKTTSSNLNVIILNWKNLYDINSNIISKEKTSDNVFEIEKLKLNFNAEIRKKFEIEVDNFKNILEFSRKNNEKLRSNSIYLKSSIMKYLKNDYFLKQPLEHLKEKENGGNNEISLGVLDTNYHSLALLRFSKYLKINNIVSEIQERFLDKSRNIEDMIDILKNLGYSKFYYYESAQDFLNNPENYKVLDIELKNKNNFKNNKP